MDTPLFRVCCTNSACNSLVTDLEVSIGNSTADAESIWEFVAELEGLRESEASGHTEDPKKAMHMASLMKKLHAVQEHHNGSIPLHGRLFSQWLHFVSPQECPYPHRRGTVEEVGLQNCGDGCLVTDEEKDSEKRQFTAKASYFNPDSAADDEEFWLSDEFWMSQWTFEEELLNHPDAEHSISDLPRKMMALAYALMIVVPIFLAGSCVISTVSKCGFADQGGAAFKCGFAGGDILGKSHQV